MYNNILTKMSFKIKELVKKSVSPTHAICLIGMQIFRNSKLDLISAAWSNGDQMNFGSPLLNAPATGPWARSLAGMQAEPTGNIYPDEQCVSVLVDVRWAKQVSKK